MSARERSPRSRVRAHVWLLAMIVATTLGAQCSSPPPPQVTVYVDPPLETLPHLTWNNVRIMVDTGSAAVQAFELAVQLNGGVLWLDDVLTGQFDDDGDFFLDPQVDPVAGTAEGIVDLRHGNDPATGTLRLARLRVFTLSQGTGTIEITKAEVATPSGQPLTVQATSGTIEVE